MTKKINERVEEGQYSYGLVLSLKDSAIIEMAAYAGYDFVRIDCEHDLFDHSTIANMISIANLLNTSIIVRISSLNDIPRLLDFGASGVVVPSINNKEEAINAVNFVKYAPLGSRGMFGNARYLKYGKENLKENLRKANDEISLTIQIETKEGLDNIDEILSVEGIDMVATGKGDLSQALGYAGEPNHSRVLAAEDFIIKKTLKYGKIPNILASTPERVDMLKKQGVRCFSVGRDTVITIMALKNHLSLFKK